MSHFFLRLTYLSDVRQTAYRNSEIENRAVFAVIYEQPFPTPYCRQVGCLRSVVSAAGFI